MTKEELAKKRGIKINQEVVSPSEALLTARVEPKKSSGPAAGKSSAKKPAAAIKSSPKAPTKSTVANKEPIPSGSQDITSETPKIVVVPNNPAPVKNKGGRPKTRTEEVKIANIAIPLSVYENMTEHALALYDNNLTGYVNALIRKDLEANLDNYKKVSAFMKKAKGD